MPWYGWAVVVVGAIVLAAVGLILSVPIRMYRGLISRHALARVRVAGGGSLVDVRFAGDVSSERVSALDPWLAARPRMLAGLRTSLGGGAAVPAVVVATDPLRIACYADEFDAVVLLRFDSPPPGRAHVALGDRLLCVATYFWARVRPAVRPVAPDIFPGPRFTDWYDNFAPFVVDFISDDAEAIGRCMAMISEDDWARAFELGCARVTTAIEPRDGRPSLCHRPAQARAWLKRLTRAMSEPDVKPLPADGSWGARPSPRARVPR